MPRRTLSTQNLNQPLDSQPATTESVNDAETTSVNNTEDLSSDLEVVDNSVKRGALASMITADTEISAEDVESL